MIHNPAYKWIPQYTTENGRAFDVATVSLDECPRGVVTDEMQQLIELEAMNRHTREATGACLFGGDAAVWPALWHDVVVTLQMERIHEEEARIRAARM